MPIPLAARSIIPLKWFVICFGLMLIGGFVLVFAAMLHKGMNAPRAACSGASFALQGRRLESARREGDRVQITLASPGKTELIELDYCTGQEVGRFLFQP